MFIVFMNADINRFRENDFLMDGILTPLEDSELLDRYDEQHSRYNPTDFHRFLWCKLNISECHTRVNTFSRVSFYGCFFTEK